MNREPGTCLLCGRVLDEHDRHVRFRLPAPVLDVPEAERDVRTWGNDVLMEVQGVGSFVRVLLPVRLTGGYAIHFGLWLGVPGDQLRHAYDVWWEDGYRDLVLDGLVANAVPPWGEAVFGAAARATVRDPDEIPYITSTSHATLSEVLGREWDHDYVLGASEAMS